MALRKWAHPCRAGSRAAHEPQERDWRGGLCGEQAVELLRDFYAAGNPKGACFTHRSCQPCALLPPICALHWQRYDDNLHFL